MRKESKKSNILQNQKIIEETMNGILKNLETNLQVLEKSGERKTYMNTASGVPKLKIMLAPGSVLPKYATEGSSGLDLYANLGDDRTFIIPANAVDLIPTGIFIEIPRGYEGQIRSRSGLALNSRVIVLNAPGTIDSDYRGEIKVILYNLGILPFCVNNLDKIAQLVISPVTQFSHIEVVSFLDETKRSDKGFGSTGVR